MENISESTKLEEKDSTMSLRQPVTQIPSKKRQSAGLHKIIQILATPKAAFKFCLKKLRKFTFECYPFHQEQALHNREVRSAVDSSLLSITEFHSKTSFSETERKRE